MLQHWNLHNNIGVNPYSVAFTGWRSKLHEFNNFSLDTSQRSSSSSIFNRVCRAESKILFDCYRTLVVSHFLLFENHNRTIAPFWVKSICPLNKLIATFFYYDFTATQNLYPEQISRIHYGIALVASAFWKHSNSTYDSDCSSNCSINWPTLVDSSHTFTLHIILYTYFIFKIFVNNFGLILCVLRRNF